MSQAVRVFVSSPDDVSERSVALDVISKLSQRLDELYDCTLTPMNWEGFVHLTAKDNRDVMESIFPGVRRSHVFIAVMGRKYRTRRERAHQLSGTEREIRDALKSRKSLEILIYFRKLSPRDLKHAQAREVERMR